MPGFKGRALIYPSLLIAGWIVGRSVSLSASSAEEAESKVTHGTAQMLTPSSAFTVPSCPMPISKSTPVTKLSVLALHPAIRQGKMSDRRESNEFIDFDSLGTRTAQDSGSIRIFDTTTLLTGEESTVASWAASSLSEPAQRNAKRLQIFGYSFWRQHSGSAGLAPNAQYGGSQFGAIATWDPIGAAGKGPALLLRGSGTPDGVQREIAIGTRWQPKHDWPVSLSLERRFRANAPDSFATYLAGGFDRLPVVGRLALDAYGQAGYSIGDQSSPFVDAHARAQHPLAKPLGVPVRIGAGAWVGGQKGAFRGDIGPTLSADIDARLAKFTLQIDWRKRIVGNAAPADGLAVTVSTGF